MDVLAQDAGFEIVVTGSKQGPVVEVAEEETLKYLRDFFKTSEPVDAKKEVPKEEERAAYDFRLEFKRQQSFKHRQCVVRVLQECAFLGCVRGNGTSGGGLGLAFGAACVRHAGGATLAFSQCIPFQQGWQCRATATGLLSDWEKFKDAAKKVGRLVMLTAADKKHEAEARQGELGCVCGGVLASEKKIKRGRIVLVLRRVAVIEGACVPRCGRYEEIACRL